MPSVFYPIEGDPGHVCVGGVQSSGHGGVVAHQLVSQTSLHTGVDSGPGDRGSVQLETLRRQDRASATKRIQNLLRQEFFSFFFPPPSLSSPFSETLIVFKTIIIYTKHFTLHKAQSTGFPPEYF